MKLGREIRPGPRLRVPALWGLGLLLWLLAGFFTRVEAGPFTESYSWGGLREYPRVSKDSGDLVAWATGWITPVAWGYNLTEEWKTPEKALGPAEGTAFDIVSLGEGGRITLTFDRPIRDGEGWDFAVFENSFNGTFLELAYVEVSTDGVVFVRFDNVSLTQSPVDGFGSIDYTEIFGLAGKYPAGYGTPFDLAFLADKPEVSDGRVDLQRIRYVRVVDIVGDGSCYDHPPPGWGGGKPIYDPYPTTQSAGFDLDAVGVRYQGPPEAVKGDLDGNGTVDESDLETALQVLAGEYPGNLREDYPDSGADVNGDGRVGMEEVLFILYFQ